MASIGFVVADFPVVSETFVTDQITAMLDRGFDVGIVCDQRWALPEGIGETGRLPELMGRVRPRWLAGGLLSRIHERLSRSMQWRLEILADAVSDARLNRFDVLVAHFGPLGLRLARSRQRGVLRRPFATFLHGYDLAIPFNTGGMASYGPLFRHCDLLLPVSGVFRDMLVRSGAAPEKIAVLPMGVDCAAIPFAPPQRAAEGLRILTTARLVEKKGIDDAIAALAALHRRRPSLAWRYDVIGDGPLGPALVEQAAEAGLAGRVRMLGPLPHDEVRRRLTEADLFLLPSRTTRGGDMEGLPVALQEAMAAGVTVVSTTHSGIPELVADGESGLLVPERDVAALSARLEWAADHPADCAALARAARTKVASEFDSLVLNDRLATALAGLAARAG